MVGDGRDNFTQLIALYTSFSARNHTFQPLWHLVENAGIVARTVNLTRATRGLRACISRLVGRVRLANGERLII